MVAREPEASFEWLDRRARLESALWQARLQRDDLRSVETTSGASYLEGAARCGVLRFRLWLHGRVGRSTR